MKKYFSRIWVPVSWTIFIFILLALPGSVLPSEQGFEIPNLDKWVHAAIFAVFVFTWSVYYNGNPQTQKRKARVFTRVLLVAVAYGAGMEFLQKYVIPNRDFEIGDIIADATGAVLAYIFCLIKFAGKKST